MLHETQLRDLILNKTQVRRLSLANAVMNLPEFPVRKLARSSTAAEPTESESYS